MALSVRTRFEVFKRDDFTCKYCGRRSPEVILEVDHIVPSCDGGSDDAINLTTSCWDCNRGKGGVALATVMTGEDPHDRAIELLERKRQLEEYNRALQLQHDERDAQAWQLWRYWQQTQRGITSGESLEHMPKRDYTWLMNTLAYCPYVKLIEFMDAAGGAGATNNLRYVMGCVRNWREAKPPAPAPSPALDATARFEATVAEIQRLLSLSRPDAIAAIIEGNDTNRAYERDELIKTVLRHVHDAEWRRRHVGYCQHPEPKCETYFLCVMREVCLRLDIDGEPEFMR